MRSRLPAALLLVLSWLLPATGHAEVAAQVAAPAVTRAVTQAVTQLTAIQAAADPPAVAQLGSTPPPPPPLAQVRQAGHDQAGPGGQALPAAASARSLHVWSAVVRRPAVRAAADRPGGAAAARAPPSTVL
ncbi:hypothetical protein ACFYUV_30210 [Nonomuraea sp. NPDC003560]|uniref:hypothetical protein n=1 Tax=Nonomuraea sp. NPDC003560 TaxID=3364341 RepID=UPI003682B265